MYGDVTAAAATLRSRYPKQRGSTNDNKLLPGEWRVYRSLQQRSAGRTRTPSAGLRTESIPGLPVMLTATISCSVITPKVLRVIPSVVVSFIPARQDFPCLAHGKCMGDRKLSPTSYAVRHDTPPVHPRVGIRVILRLQGPQLWTTAEHPYLWRTGVGNGDDVPVG